MSKMAVLFAAFAMLLCVAHAKRDLNNIEFPTDVPISQTVLYNSSFPDSQNHPLPLNDSMLTHTGSEFSPDQVHITLWTPESVLVSWATGLGRLTANTNPATPYDVNNMSSIVKYGTSASSLTSSVNGTNDGKTSKRVVYTYKFAAESGDINGSGTVYQSPILHHVVIAKLTPGQPPWSDFREPAFGHGLFIMHNATTAEWKWNRNTDSTSEYLDHVFITKNPSQNCTNLVVKGTDPVATANAKGIPIAAPAATTSPAGASPNAGSSPIAAGASSGAGLVMVSFATMLPIVFSALFF